MDESEAMLSSRFIDMDENYFTPTIVAHSQESVSQRVLARIIFHYVLSGYEGAYKFRSPDRADMKLIGAI